MMIGQFRASQDGYSGRISTLGIDAEISIVPAQPSDADTAPDWRILRGDSDSFVEIGAGWNRTGERAGAFIAVQIDDPHLPAPLRANLFRSTHDDAEHHLLWSRPSAPKRGNR